MENFAVLSFWLIWFFYQKKNLYTMVIWIKTIVNVHVSMYKHIWTKTQVFCVEFLGVVPFNTWLISSCEVNKCCYKLNKCTKWPLFHSKWSKLSFWVKIVVIFSVAQLVATVIFFSAWDKSRVKWDNSRNSTQKMRT